MERFNNPLDPDYYADTNLNCIPSNNSQRVPIKIVYRSDGSIVSVFERVDGSDSSYEAAIIDDDYDISDLAMDT